MNDITSGPPVLTATASGNQPALVADDEAGLEHRMSMLGLSHDTRRFLREVRHAERQLNDAFNKSRQGGELDKQVRQVYRDLYGTGDAVRGSRSPILAEAGPRATPGPCCEKRA